MSLIKPSIRFPIDLAFRLEGDWQFFNFSSLVFGVLGAQPENVPSTSALYPISWWDSHSGWLRLPFFMALIPDFHVFSWFNNMRYPICCFFPNKCHFMGFSISRQTISYCCLCHAADTPPLEGLPFLRCAIYDRVEGLQIWKMKFAKMGGWGGVITFLTSIIHGPRNLLPLYTKKGTLGLTAGHGAIMSPWFALLDSVAVALPKALWHWGFEKRKRHGWVDVCMGYLKIINFWCFF